MANDAPYIGKLNTRIAVYKVVKTRTATGEAKESNVLVAKPWAARADGSGSVEADGKLTAMVNRSYVIRRIAEIAADGVKMHIVHSGVKFRIEAIKEIGRSHLQIMVSANE